MPGDDRLRRLLPLFLTRRVEKALRCCLFFRRVSFACLPSFLQVRTVGLWQLWRASQLAKLTEVAKRAHGASFSFVSPLVSSFKPKSERAPRERLSSSTNHSTHLSPTRKPIVALELLRKLLLLFVVFVFVDGGISQQLAARLWRTQTTSPASDPSDDDLFHHQTPDARVSRRPKGPLGTLRLSL